MTECKGSDDNPIWCSTHNTALVGCCARKDQIIKNIIYRQTYRARMTMEEWISAQEEVGITVPHED